jgi:epoxyqueuosine reductase
VDPVAAAALVRKEALTLGFVRVGFAPASLLPGRERHRAWLAQGYSGGMDYLAGDRADPRALLASARTVVSLAFSYARDEVPAERLAAGPRGTIARYARGADYHMVLKARLQRLAERVGSACGRPVAWRACVDTAPLLEREAARVGGLGFIGKNTMVIAPGAGSWLLLGELLLDLECRPSAPEEPRCGECRACLDACPTGAFVDGYTLDARRCISYLTIELQGAIPRELRPLVGDRIFGCDVCQEVCPFNAGSLPAGAPELAPRADHGHPALVQLLGLGAAQFRKWQRRTAMRRIHRAQLLRNVCVALGNVGSAAELAPLAAALDSEPQPLVREHAAWAIARIGRRLPEATAAARAILEARRADPLVAAELALARDCAFVS